MSQNHLILSHLMAGKSITPIEALNKYGCMRLAARVRDLKTEGAHIVTRMEERNNKKFACYYLIGFPQPSPNMEI